MKTSLPLALVLSGVASLALLTGCDSSKTTAPAPNPAPSTQTAPGTSSAQPAKPAEVKAPEPPAQTDLKQAAADTQNAATAALDDVTKQLTTSIQAKADSVLNELSKELSTKVQSLTQSLGTEEGVKSTVQSALKSLTENKDIQSLEIYQKVAQAKLTPEQTKLATEVRDVLSAFTVQKNFSSLAASQGEVGKIVTALRSADTTTALTSLKSLSSNASLSAGQKDLLNTLVGQYAGGVQEAGKALQDGLKGLNPLKTP